MNQKSFDWFIAIAYVALIYLTLEVARIPLAFLRSHGWLRLSLSILLALTIIVVLTWTFRNHGFSLWRFALLLVIGGVYFLSAKSVKTPEEQVHFFEYGLVGILFFRALSHHLRENFFCYLLAWIFSCAAGWIDELLQGLLPNRHYDIHDVRLNAISAALGLFIYFISRHSKSPR